MASTAGRKFVKSAMAVAAFITAPLANAQIKVEVSATSDDVVGQRLVYNIREVVAGSKTLTNQFDDDEMRLRIVVVTVNPQDGGSQYSTIYSAVFVVHRPGRGLPLYLTSYVGTCGQQRVRECAEGVVSIAAKEGEDIMKAARATGR